MIAPTRPASYPKPPLSLQQGRSCRAWQRRRLPHGWNGRVDTQCRDHGGDPGDDPDPVDPHRWGCLYMNQWRKDIAQWRIGELEHIPYDDFEGGKEEQLELLAASVGAGKGIGA